ncbi:hypothetical protein PAPYR_716 [Paratrimastix pyriformis]|uniref:Uncharacterized protein n=1 Tax=Paratrimastix pyriformis TaxID=342808 RepID=A0ABQ8UUA4_9EUKA|nr:hypothetical protein PAPYR_716 [Paratrimastix pyriformis]
MSIQEGPPELHCPTWTSHTNNFSKDENVLALLLRLEFEKPFASRPVEDYSRICNVARSIFGLMIVPGQLQMAVMRHGPLWRRHDAGLPKNVDEKITSLAKKALTACEDGHPSSMNSTTTPVEGTLENPTTFKNDSTRDPTTAIAEDIEEDSTSAFRNDSTRDSTTAIAEDIEEDIEEDSIPVEASTLVAVPDEPLGLPPHHRRQRPKTDGERQQAHRDRIAERYREARKIFDKLKILHAGAGNAEGSRPSSRVKWPRRGVRQGSTSIGSRDDEAGDPTAASHAFRVPDEVPRRVRQHIIRAGARSQEGTERAILRWVGRPGVSLRTLNDNRLALELEGEPKSGQRRSRRVLWGKVTVPRDVTDKSMIDDLRLDIGEAFVCGPPLASDQNPRVRQYQGRLRILNVRQQLASMLQQTFAEPPYCSTTIPPGAHHIAHPPVCFGQLQPSEEPAKTIAPTTEQKTAPIPNAQRTTSNLSNRPGIPEAQDKKMAPNQTWWDWMLKNNPTWARQSPVADLSGGNDLHLAFMLQTDGSPMGHDNVEAVLVVARLLQDDEVMITKQHHLVPLVFGFIPETRQVTGEVFAILGQRICDAIREPFPIALPSGRNVRVFLHLVAQGGDGKAAQILSGCAMGTDPRRDPWAPLRLDCPEHRGLFDWDHAMQLALYYPRTVASAWADIALEAPSTVACPPLLRAPSPQHQGRCPRNRSRCTDVIPTLHIIRGFSFQLWTLMASRLGSLPNGKMRIDTLNTRLAEQLNIKAWNHKTPSHSCRVWRIVWALGEVLFAPPVLNSQGPGSDTAQTIKRMVQAMGEYCAAMYGGGGSAYRRDAKGLLRLAVNSYTLLKGLVDLGGPVGLYGAGVWPHSVVLFFLFEPRNVATEELESTWRWVRSMYRTAGTLDRTAELCRKLQLTGPFVRRAVGNSANRTRDRISRAWGDHHYQSIEMAAAGPLDEALKTLGFDLGCVRVPISGAKVRYLCGDQDPPLDSPCPLTVRQATLLLRERGLQELTRVPEKFNPGEPRALADRIVTRAQTKNKTRPKRFKEPTLTDAPKAGGSKHTAAAKKPKKRPRAAAKVNVRKKGRTDAEADSDGPAPFEKAAAAREYAP